MTTNRTPLIEPWVDSKTVAAHMGFKDDHIRRMARAGKLPGVQLQNGAKTHWRFKLSEVEAFLAAEQRRLALGVIASAISVTARDLASFNAPTIDQLNTGTPEVSAFVYKEASTNACVV